MEHLAPQSHFCSQLFCKLAQASWLQPWFTYCITINPHSLQRVWERALKTWGMKPDPTTKANSFPMREMFWSNRRNTYIPFFKNQLQYISLRKWKYSLKRNKSRHLYFHKICYCLFYLSKLRGITIIRNYITKTIV